MSSLACPQATVSVVFYSLNKGVWVVLGYAMLTAEEVVRLYSHVHSVSFAICWQDTWFLLAASNTVERL